MRQIGEISFLLFQGILYVDKTIVGWRPIAKAWLEHRTQQEIHVYILLILHKLISHLTKSVLAYYFS